MEIFEELTTKESKTEQELSLEDKIGLANIWLTVVIGRGNVPVGLEKMTTKEFKSWLYDSLMAEVEILIKDWDLEPNAGLIEQICQETEPQKRAELEFSYLKICYEKIQNFIQKTGNKDSKWDSWPSRMKENSNFNCVGAALLGNYFLDRAGVKGGIGYAYSHVMTIAQLSNGDWVYADFMNGPDQLQKIKPELVELGGESVLRVKEKFIDYRLIQLASKRDISSSVLGNLDSAQYNALQPEDANPLFSALDKLEAREYFDKFKPVLTAIDLNEVYLKIFKDKTLLNETDEMLQEAARINFLYVQLPEVMDKMIKDLSKTKQNDLLKEIQLEINMIEKFFYSGEEKLLAGLSSSSRSFILKYSKTIGIMRDKDWEFYEELIQRFLNRY